MSNGRKRNDEARAKVGFGCGRVHCAEGHCSKKIRQGFEWAFCRNFVLLVKSGKTPSVNCPFYVP